MTPEHYNRSARHWRGILKTKQADPKASLPINRGGNSYQTTPAPISPESSITPMDTQTTEQTNNFRPLLAFVLAAYSVFVYGVLVLYEAISQINDANSFFLHMPVILIGLGYLGGIHTAWLRDNVAMLIWFLSVLWMLGLWT